MSSEQGVHAAPLAPFAHWAQQPDEYDDTFFELSRVPADLARGVYCGEVIAVPALGVLPWPARVLATRFLSRLVSVVWKGTTINEDGSGHNLWFRRDKPRRFARFASFNHEYVSLHDYGITANNVVLRGFTDELVAIGRDRYLGRMSMIVTGRAVTILYYTLRPAR